MLLKEKNYQQQSLLAQYTKTGDDKIIKQLKGVKEKGIRYYRELIFNIIWDGICNAYPIMTDFLGEDEMKNIVHRFFSSHACKNPQVWAMPKEFMDYVNNNEQTLIEQYPFLSELMLFEWKEIEMYMMPDKAIPSYKEKGSWQVDKLIINPEIEIISFTYPVFLVHPEEIDDEMKDDYLLLIYRDIDSKEVLFNIISDVVKKFINVLLQEPISLREFENKRERLTIVQKNQLKEFVHIALDTRIILGFLSK